MGAVAVGGWCAGRGGNALMGLGIGLFATGLSVLGLWGAVRLFARPVPEDRAARFQAGLIVLAFFVKLPIFVVAANFTHRLGLGADSGFLLGLALVYFSLVGGALATR